MEFLEVMWKEYAWGVTVYLFVLYSSPPKWYGFIHSSPLKIIFTPLTHNKHYHSLNVSSLSSNSLFTYIKVSPQHHPLNSKEHYSTYFSVLALTYMFFSLICKPDAVFPPSRYHCSNYGKLNAVESWWVMTYFSSMLR